MGKAAGALFISALLFIKLSVQLTLTGTTFPGRRRNSRRLNLNRGEVDDCVTHETTTLEVDESGGELEEPKDRLAYPQQTPHSGRHFRPSHPAYKRTRWRSQLLPRPSKHRRFTEGWYYRLTIPEEEVSFAFIISIEDPGQNSPLTLVCLQVIGPNDEYLVQGDRSDSKFWAWKNQQGLGHVFSYRDGFSNKDRMQFKTALKQSVWNEVVESGFQVLPTSLLGRLRGRDGTKGEILDTDGEIYSCDFSFAVEPLCGWGGTTADEQKSTAGWLSSFPIFEPHWQVTLADARATGSVTWKGTTYQFRDAPFYAEKNWGAALPEKWYWTQCNSFPGYDQLSVVAGGGIRKVPFGKKEALGMVSCHYNGALYEAVPWLGGMSWEVATWGSWVLRGNSTTGDYPFEIEVTYKCDPLTTPGLVFRAPTPDRGLVRFCRDTFDAECTLTLWLLEWDETLCRFIRRNGPPLIDGAKSSLGGAEIGGGPWWDDWNGEARLKRPIRALLRLPYNLNCLKQKLQKRLLR
jgi:tocopherol cyclase